MKKIFFSIVMIVFCLINSGCTRDLASGSYDAFTIGESAKTYEGTVTSKRKVNIKDDLGDGALIGAGAGTIAGNNVGKGKGNIAGTAGGLIVGAIVGNMIDESLHNQEGIEYVVKIKGGKLRTVVQSGDEDFKVGQKVYLIESTGKYNKRYGRSRLRAR